MSTSPSPLGDRVVYWQTKSGQSLKIRHIKSSDAPLLTELFYRLSERTLSLRFATAVINVPLERVIQEASRLATLNPEEAVALIALEEDAQAVEHLVAVARLAGMTATTAEFALTVRDDFQGQGIGSYIFDLLVQVALARGLHTLTASVLAENTPMIKLIRRLGFPIHIDTHYGESDVTIYLQD